MMLGRLRKAGVAVIAALVVLLPASCSSHHATTSFHSVSKSSSLMTLPAPGTAWSSLLAHTVGTGPVSTQTAVAAFGLAAEPLAGDSAVPTDPSGLLTDGTDATRWLVAGWGGLTKTERQSATAQLSSAARAAPGHAKASSPAGQIDLDVARARSTIASSLGRNTAQSITVVLNPALAARRTMAEKDAQSALAYSMSFDRSWGFSGPADHCAIYVNPVLYDSGNVAVIQWVVDHQVAHCFQADDFRTVDDYAGAPGWLIDGSAEWVGDSLSPLPDPWWIPYLTDISTPLFHRSYDAVGFFAYVEQTGSDPWRLFDKLLQSDDSDAAYADAVNDDFRNTWASSLAQQAFGPGWSSSGPGMVDDAYRPAITVVSDGSTVSGSVAPYTNAVLSLDAVADVVDFSVSTPYARLHAPDGSDHDGTVLSQAEFCITSSCASCPNLASLSRLPAGPAWLAVTGDVSGATYSITGHQAVCASCPVGSWTTTGYSSTPPPGQAGGISLSGGSGIDLQVDQSGSLAVDYSGMDPLSVAATVAGSSVQGSGEFAGTQSGTFALPTLQAASHGSFSPPSGQVSLSYTIQPSNASVGPVGINPFGTAGTVSWSCSGSGMTLSSSGPSAPTVRWSLSRTS